MRILMTGGTGFIGRHLRRRLVRDGHSLIDIVRPFCADRLEPLPGCQPIEGDLFALAEDLGSIDSGFDAVIHLAQANVKLPAETYRFWRINVDSTLWLLELARSAGTKRFCFASTGSVYRTSDEPQAMPLRETSPVAATSLYTASKIAAEHLISLYADGLSPVIWRLFGPYGPEQNGRFIPNLIQRIQQGQPVLLNRRDSPRMNFVFIDDVIDAIVASLAMPLSQGVTTMNIGGAAALSVREAAMLIGEVLNREVTFADTGKEFADYVGDITLAHQRLNWYPRVTFRDGIAATIKGLQPVAAS